MFQILRAEPGVLVMFVTDGHPRRLLEATSILEDQHLLARNDLEDPRVHEGGDSGREARLLLNLTHQRFLRGFFRVQAPSRQLPLPTCVSQKQYPPPMEEHSLD
jgi:hypothetical protein